MVFYVLTFRLHLLPPSQPLLEAYDTETYKRSRFGQRVFKTLLVLMLLARLFSVRHLKTVVVDVTNMDDTNSPLRIDRLQFRPRADDTVRRTHDRFQLVTSRR